MDLDEINQRLKVAGAACRVESRSGRLRLRATLPPKPGQEHKGRHQQAIGLRLNDTPTGRRQAYKEAQALAAQLLTRTFDWAAWGHEPPTEAAQLEALWERFLAQKAVMLSSPVAIPNYQTLRRHLEAFGEVRDREQAVQFIAYLQRRGLAANSIRRYVSCANSFWDWVIDVGALPGPNPFAGIRKHVKGGRKRWDAFSQAELDRIFMALETTPRLCLFVDFFRFCALTGCRVSEAFGIRWRDIAADCGEIVFEEALVLDYQKRHIRKTNKTACVRVFLCSVGLRAWLQTLPRAEPDALLFTYKGEPLRHTTTERVWRRALERAEVPYRPPMILRHTLITHTIPYMSPVDLADQLGHTPQTMMRHYARSRRQRMPDSLTFQGLRESAVPDADASDSAD